MRFSNDDELNSQEILHSLRQYFNDPTMPSRWNDVLFVCDAVLQTALAAVEGRCNFSTARRVCQLFDLLVLERTIEPSTQFSWEKLDHACETAWPWKSILMETAAVNPDEYFDDPATFRKCFIDETEYFNFAAKVECQVHLEDLQLLNY